MSCMLFEHGSDNALWHEIKNDPPPLGFDVLVFNARTGNMYITTRYENYWNMSNGVKISPPEKAVNITHWRLLPAPPMSEKLTREIAEFFDDTKGGGEG